MTTATDGSSAGGAGVGLHRARTLVEAENGRLRVANARPNLFEIVFGREVRPDLLGGPDGPGASR